SRTRSGRTSSRASASHSTRWCTGTAGRDSDAGRQIAPEPFEDRLEAQHAVERGPRARELMALRGEAEHLDLLAEKAQRGEQMLALLDAAAQVLFGVQHEHRRLHLVHVRRGRAVEIGA